MDEPKTVPDTVSHSAEEELALFAETGERDPVIRAHLARCGSCRERLTAIRDRDHLFERLRGALVEGNAPPSAEVPGYEMLEEVERGAQGIVFRALQQSTKRLVALKVQRAGALATRTQRLRFERELDILASLRHPGIVTVYDGGVTSDGRHWLAMEFVEGAPLGEHVAAHRAELGAAGVVRLFVEICEAVNAAHRRGVIHRDLKPDNILVAPGVTSQGAPRPRILDFGLARAVDPEIQGDAAFVTTPGGLLGTLAYAAPEQAIGASDEIDTRTDVYAIGVMLYELLSGHLPIDVSGRLSEIVDRIVMTPPRPFSTQSRIPFPIDRDLETIVLTALAKSPARRYQSVEALRADLLHWLNGEPIDARRASRSYVLRKLVWRHRRAVLAAVALLILVVAFGIAMTVLYGRAAIEAEKLARINLFLEDTLGSVEPEDPDSEVTVRRMLDEGVFWIDLALGDDPQTEAAVRTILGNGYRNIGLLDAAERQLEESLKWRVDRSGRNSLEAAAGLSALGLLRRQQGRLDEAIRLFEEALRIREQFLGESAPELDATQANLAGAAADAGDLERAERLEREVLARRRSRSGDGHADVAMSRVRLAGILDRMERSDEALAEHAAAMRIREAVLDPRHPDLARSRIATGRLLLRHGSVDEARRLAEQAWQVLREIRGDRAASTREAEALLAECGP